MLFQPTNITPSALGETGNGVVDITQDLNVSWQVNGNSPMTAFMISIYLNDANSAPVYTTGRRADNCPFYGVDYKGETRMFSVPIQANALVGAKGTSFYSASGGITAAETNYTTFSSAVGGAHGNYYFRYDGSDWYLNGNTVSLADYGISITGTAASGDTVTVVFGMINGSTYKMVITQYWGENESVTQIAASAFITRSLPTISVDQVPDPLASRAYSFTASYSQAQGDTLAWVRWRIALASDLENPILDTQNIYGTSQLRVDYEGFFTGNSYAVSCTIQTENGVEIGTGWLTFAVEYSLASLAGNLTACRAKGASAVLVQWPLVTYIPGTAHGTYAVQNGNLLLGADGSVIWNSVNSGAMNFGTPWSIAYETRLAGESISLLTMETDSGALEISYKTPELTVNLSGTKLYAPIPPDSYISLILTPDHLYLRYTHATGGLTPSLTLYPSETLYPRADSQTTSEKKDGPVSYTQGNILDITLSGPQTCNYLWITAGDFPDDVIDQIYNHGGYEPTYAEGTYMLANFTDDLQGGSLAQYNGSLTGLALYRQEGDSPRLEYLATVPLSTQAILDYGARSQTAYMYYLFPTSDTVYVTDAVISDSITPVFWSWSVLECVLQDDGHYLIHAEYDFGKNLTSGEISNNNSPTVLGNFTPYPLVQPSPNLYRSGTLQSYIGTVDYANGNKYSDTISLRDAITALGQSQNTLFLKNRKGDLIKIRISGPIGMTTDDNTREQAQTVSLPWVEVGDGSSAVIIGPADSAPPAATPDNSDGGACLTVVDAVPSQKLTTLIYSTDTQEYYIWRD